MLCPNCGYQNAATSRFCRQCGTALHSSTPIKIDAAQPPAQATQSLVAPMTDEDAALQEELVTQPVNPEPTSGKETGAIDPPLQPGTTIEGYKIIELRDERDGKRTYRAEAPGNVCAQCGAQTADPSSRFCENCGAELLPRDVLLIEDSAGAEQSSGPWQAINLPEDPVRALLPPLQLVEQDGKRYLVVEEAVPGWQSLAELLSGYGETPDQPAALEEDDALPIALQLAQLIQYLHRNNLALGDLSLAQLLLGPQQRLRLRDVQSIQPLNDAAQKADLMQLHHTLEDLTRTPRATRKLDAAAVEGGSTAPKSLQEVLALARMGGLSSADDWVTALSAVADSKRAVQGLRTRIGAHSHVGMVRELNEDSLLTMDWKMDAAGRAINAGLYVVADGMGGHAGGEVASSLAVQNMASIAASALLELVADSGAGLGDAQLSDVALRASEQANMAVVQEARRRNNDMGTTLTFALVVGDRCVIGNVGDSRTYLIRNGQMQRISKDHSLVQRLVDVGQIQPDEIYTHPHRNAILRSLGEQPQVQVDIFPLRLQDGDIIFCCSDGQWEMVRDPRMSEIILAAPDPQTAVQQLIDEGNQNGGEDNITAVLVQFQAASSQA
ncbi:MAG: protein phosphatase 2C domain-containing protein [Chloroflexi bacterium]|nr:protein phosphatase 2C domain-containing protein [Chloroflexota bacterium]